MFAKLFTTPQGQCLVETVDGDDEDGKYRFGLRLRMDTVPPFEGVTAILESTLSYGDMISGEEARDKRFAEFDQAEAETLALKGIA